MSFFEENTNGARDGKGKLAEWAALAYGMVSRLLALVALVIHLPAIIMIGLLVIATSHGPAFVKKAYRRHAGAGNLVYLYEFRTECWLTWNETWLGKLLNRADIHRLPCCVNVLTGDVLMGERVQRIGP